MSTKPTSGQEASESIDEKRAQYEQFEFAVCHDGEHVNVRNTTYDEPGHVYSVTVEAGAVVACSCPHHEHRGVRCKHIRAVANEPIVLAAVDAAGKEADKEVRADGGTEVERPAITEHIDPTIKAARNTSTAKAAGARFSQKFGGALEAIPRRRVPGRRGSVR